jgi:tetratricopeptide (TPR) repeat protein
MMQMQHQAPPSGPPVHQAQFPPAQAIANMNEAVWMQIGSLSELMRAPEDAMHAYERALQANPQSAPAMNAIGMLLKGREAFDKALEFFRTIVAIDNGNGEAWGNLGMLLSAPCTEMSLTLLRPLLLDDGEPSKSIRRIPASPGEPPRPQGKYPRHRTQRSQSNMSW